MVRKGSEAVRKKAHARLCHEPWQAVPDGIPARAGAARAATRVASGQNAAVPPSCGRSGSMSAEPVLQQRLQLPDLFRSDGTGGLIGSKQALTCRTAQGLRSEERRVGKESRARGAAGQETQ